MSQLLTIAEVCDLLHICRTKCWALRRAGVIKPSQLHARRFNRADILALTQTQA
jgi:Helix-turn-helix domain